MNHTTSDPKTDDVDDLRRRLTAAEAIAADVNAAARDDQAKAARARYDIQSAELNESSSQARALEDAYAHAAQALASAAAALIAEQRRFDHLAERVSLYEGVAQLPTTNRRRPAAPALLPVTLFRDLKPAQSIESVLAEWRGRNP